MACKAMSALPQKRHRLLHRTCPLSGVKQTPAYGNVHLCPKADMRSSLRLRGLYECVG